MFSSLCFYPRGKLNIWSRTPQDSPGLTGPLMAPEAVGQSSSGTPQGGKQLVSN